MALGVKNEHTPAPGVKTERTPVEGDGCVRVAVQGSGGAGRRERAVRGTEGGRGGVEHRERAPRTLVGACAGRWKAVAVVPGVESEPARSHERARGGAAAV